MQADRDLVSKGASLNRQLRDLGEYWSLTRAAWILRFLPGLRIKPWAPICSP